MALRDELIALVPAAIRASQDSQAVADAYNATLPPVVGGVDRPNFTSWCASTGQRAVIQDTAASLADPLRSVALSLLDFVQGGSSPSLDLSSPANQAMLGRWQGSGKASPEQIESLTALATRPATPINELTIRAACWSDDGVWQL